MTKKAAAIINDVHSTAISACGYRRLSDVALTALETAHQWKARQANEMSNYSSLFFFRVDRQISWLVTL